MSNKQAPKASTLAELGKIINGGSKPNPALLKKPMPMTSPKIAQSAPNPTTKPVKPIATAGPLTDLPSRTLAETETPKLAPTTKRIGTFAGDDAVTDFHPPQTPVIPNAQTPGSTAYGPLPEFRWVPVRDLKVDDSYQRDRTSERSRGVITRIKEAFRWYKFGALIGFRRNDGTLYIPDGQHRLTGANELKISHVPVLVFPIAALSEFSDANSPATDDTPENIARKHESEAFVGINRDRKNASPLDIYHASIAAGDTKAIELNNLITGAGLKVSRHSNVAYYEPNEIGAAPAVSAALSRHGDKVVSAALSAIWEAYCSTTSRERPARGSRINSPVIQGVSEIYGAYMNDPRFDPDRLIDRLGETDATDWASAARKWQELHKLKVRESVMAAILESYNKGLKEANRLPKFGPTGGSL